MFSYNSKHGWCTTCVGTGLKLTREQRAAYDDTILADDDRGREQTFAVGGAGGRGVVDEPCPDCEGTRLNRRRARGHVRRPSDRGSRPWTVATRARGSKLQLSELKGRDADIARDVVSEIGAACNFWKKSGSAI